MKPHPDLNTKRRFGLPQIPHRRYPSLSEDFENPRPGSLSSENSRFPYVRLIALLALIAIIAALASRK